MRKFGLLTTVMSLIMTVTLISCDESGNIFPEDKPFDGSGLVTFLLNDTTKIPYAECLYNHENNIGISFDSVLTDCRCPKNVECFWAGYVSVSMRLYNGNAKPVSFSLENYNDKNRLFVNDTTISGYNIKLIDCLPYPDINVERKFSDYYVKVLVSQVKK